MTVNAQSVAELIEEESGLTFKAVDCEWVFGDNDKKLHSDVPKSIILISFLHKWCCQRMGKAWNKSLARSWCSERSKKHFRIHRFKC